MTGSAGSKTEPIETEPTAVIVRAPPSTLDGRVPEVIEVPPVFTEPLIATLPLAVRLKLDALMAAVVLALV